MESPPDRVRLAEELEGGMVSNDGVIRQLGCHEIRIDSYGAWFDAAGNGGINPAPYSHETAGCHMIGEQIVAYLGLRPSAVCTATNSAWLKIGWASKKSLERTICSYAHLYLKL